MSPIFHNQATALLCRHCSQYQYNCIDKISIISAYSSVLSLLPSQMWRYIFPRFITYIKSMIRFLLHFFPSLISFAYYINFFFYCLLSLFYVNTIQCIHRYRQTYFFSRDKEFNQIIAGHYNNAIENHLKTIGDACNRMTEYLSIKSSVENFFTVKFMRHT